MTLQRTSGHLVENHRFAGIVDLGGRPGEEVVAWCMHLLNHYPAPKKRPGRLWLKFFLNSLKCFFYLGNKERSKAALATGKWGETERFRRRRGAEQAPRQKRLSWEVCCKAALIICCVPWLLSHALKDTDFCDGFPGSPADIAEEADCEQGGFPAGEEVRLWLGAP